jgi:hypothetical protein
VVASSLHTMASHRNGRGALSEIPGYLRAARDVSGTKLEPYAGLWDDAVSRTQELHESLSAEQR